MNIKPQLIRQVNFDDSGLRTASDLFNKAVGSAKEALDAKVAQDTNKALSQILKAQSIQEMATIESLDGDFVDTGVINDAFSKMKQALQQQEYQKNRDAVADNQWASGFAQDQQRINQSASQWEKEFDFEVGRDARANEQFNKQFGLDTLKANAVIANQNAARKREQRELQLGEILLKQSIPNAVDKALSAPELFTTSDGKVNERMATIVSSPDIQSAVKGAMDSQGNISNRGWKFIENRFKELGLDANDFKTYKYQYESKVGNPIAKAKEETLSAISGLATPKDIEFTSSLLEATKNAQSPDSQIFQSIVNKEREASARANTLINADEFAGLVHSILGDYGGSRNKDAIETLRDAQSTKGDLLTASEARAIIEAGKNDGTLFDTFSESAADRLARELFKK